MKTNTAKQLELTAQNFNLRTDKIDVKKTYYVYYALSDGSGIVEKFTGEKLLLIAEKVINSLRIKYSSSKVFDVEEYMLNLFRNVVDFYSISHDREYCEYFKEAMSKDVQDFLDGNTGNWFELFDKKNEFALFHFFYDKKHEYYESNNFEIFDVTLIINNEELGVRVASDRHYSKYSDEDKRILDGY